MIDPSTPFPQSASPQERIEGLLQEQVRLLSLIASDIEEERRKRKNQVTLLFFLGFLKYALIAGSIFFAIWYVQQMLNSYIGKLQQAVPTVPSINLEKIPGIGNFDWNSLQR